MKLSHILLLSATALFSFAACDNIDEADRFEGPIGGGGGSEVVTVKKNVLVEDFTGQKCSNCPLAHKTVEELHEAFGAERVIAVALHGGHQSVDESNTKIKGLANAESKEYNNRAAVPSYPKGRIDRQGGLLDFEKWTAGVAVRLEVPAKVDIHLQNVAYDAASRKLSFESLVKGLENVNGNLQAWLTESNIVAIQTLPAQWGGGNDKEYVHNHVFRAAVNGLDGDALALEANETVTKNYSFTLSEKWVAENMAIVVFYYNADGVMQVVEAPVINK